MKVIQTERKKLNVSESQEKVSTLLLVLQTAQECS